MTIRIVPTTDQWLPGFHAALDAVARERAYLAFLAAPPLDETAAFVRGVLHDGGIQMLAVTAADEVVGWCDVSRVPWDGLRHGGRLGMGLVSEYRGQGHGRRLLEATIAAARAAGIERIELDVFASNRNAIRLYEAAGFAHEGRKVRYRKLDGVYDDVVIMALVSGT